MIHFTSCRSGSLKLSTSQNLAITEWGSGNSLNGFSSRVSSDEIIKYFAVAFFVYMTMDNTSKTI